MRSDSVFRYFFAFLDVLLGSLALGTLGIFVDESVALVLGITIAVEFLLLYTLACQFKLALHDEHCEILTHRHKGIGFEGILAGDDACLVVATACEAVTEIVAEVEIQLCREILLKHEFVGEFKHSCRRLRLELRLWEEVEADGDCISLKTLAVNGGDLMEAGVEKGKAIGETLAWLLDMVLENPELNKKEILLGKLEERKTGKIGS